MRVAQSLQDPSVHVDYHAMWIDPNFTDRLFVGNDGGIAISRDRGDTWRFNYIRAAAGFGFRYRTPVGPIRLDFGFLIPRWQVVNGTPPPNAFNIFRFIRGGVPGAIHFTIGEAF